MKTYKILWLDDQYDKLENIAWKAEKQGILLEGFKSYEEGFAYLEAHLNDFSGVLLDALFFAKRDDGDGDESPMGLGQAVQRLAELKARKPLPWFILSGQPDLERNSFFLGTYGQHFVKFNEESEQALFAAIKDGADRLIHTQLKHQHTDVFAVCTAAGIGEGAAPLLLQILEYLNDPTGKPDADTYLNQLRQLVEALLYAAHRHGLLPNECVRQGQVNLTWSGRFYAGKDVIVPNECVVLATNSFLPPVLSASLLSLIELTSNGSHYQQDAQISADTRQVAKMRLEQLRQRVRTPYLLTSLTYQLLDILVCFKSVLDSPAELTKYQGKWSNNPASQTGANPVILGRVKRIAEGGFGFFISEDGTTEGFIPPGLVQAHQLVATMPIQVTLGPLPANGRSAIVQAIIA